MDDHPIFLDGIRKHLDSLGEFDLQDAANGAEALRKARAFEPDIVLMDISMPHMNGLELIVQLHKQVPNAKVIVLTMHENREYIAQMVQHGARGYLLKDTSPAELIRAIQLVNSGEVFFSPAASRALLDNMARLRNRQGGARSIAAITDRERQVLTHLADGMNNKQIATKLGISVRTVETHRERMMHKLDIHSIAGLTRYAIAHGIASLE